MWLAAVLWIGILMPIQIRIRILIGIKTSVADPELGSGMNIPDNFSRAKKIFFCVKNTLILVCGSGSEIRDLFNPGSGMEKIGYKSKFSKFILPTFSFLGIVTEPDRHAMDADPDPEK